MATVPVRTRDVWIPLRDGVRLAARVWLPADAVREPVPAVVEAIPYRLSDGTAADDRRRCAYVAAHGYACVRIDLRGTGNSGGLLLDEYLPDEADDVTDAIAWIAAQPWCTGAIGMTGISWGGFNSLQVAARRPPALRAVISLCASDDRYADDVHYRGGCVLALDMLHWATNMLALNAIPPDPAVVGDGWRDAWLARLRGTPPYIGAWLGHQRRDAYWRQGSVCEDHAAITAAVLAVGGWADGYTDAVLRLLEGLPGPRRGLIGPWGHTYPDDGGPAPAIGFLQECVRWWDHWLKGIETGVMEEPMLRAWMQEPVAPRPTHAVRPGRWVGERTWPSRRIVPRRLHPTGAGALGAGPGPARELRVSGHAHAGLDAGAWCEDGSPGDSPPDQRGEDGRSLAFTSEPLGEAFEILGRPRVTLDVASDRPLALVAVRLCDILPDGRSLLVTRGVLNLAHRAGHDRPAPLVPGRYERVAVQLGAIAHRFRAGHRLRLAVSPTYWPWAWPSPEPVVLTVRTGAATALELPERPPDAADRELRAFAAPVDLGEDQTERLHPGETSRRVRHDVAGGRTELTFRWGAGALDRLPWNGIERGYDNEAVYALRAGDPLSARVRCRFACTRARGAWRTRVEATGDMTADREAFRVRSSLDAYEGQTRMFTAAWTHVVPRDHV